MGRVFHYHYRIRRVSRLDLCYRSCPHERTGGPPKQYSLDQLGGCCLGLDDDSDGDNQHCQGNLHQRQRRVQTRSQTPDSQQRGSPPPKPAPIPQHGLCPSRWHSVVSKTDMRRCPRPRPPRSDKPPRVECRPRRISIGRGQNSIAAGGRAVRSGPLASRSSPMCGCRRGMFSRALEKPVAVSLTSFSTKPGGDICTTSGEKTCPRTEMVAIALLRHRQGDMVRPEPRDLAPQSLLMSAGSPNTATRGLSRDAVLLSG